MVAPGLMEEERNVDVFRVTASKMVDYNDQPSSPRKSPVRSPALSPKKFEPSPPEEDPMDEAAFESMFAQVIGDNESKIGVAKKKKTKKKKSLGKPD